MGSAKDFGKLHFDIRHLNAAKWADPAELAMSLSRRIHAVIGTRPNYVGD
jgi:hypothetical protein